MPSDVPTVDEFGILRQDGTFVILAPSEQALAQVLITDFGAVVHDDILEQHVVSESESRRSTLRKHASRLRKRVAPLGLAITCIRNVGYMMHHAPNPVAVNGDPAAVNGDQAAPAGSGHDSDERSVEESPGG